MLFITSPDIYGESASIYVNHSINNDKSGKRPLYILPDIISMELKRRFGVEVRLCQCLPSFQSRRPQIILWLTENFVSIQYSGRLSIGSNTGFEVEKGQGVRTNSDELKSSDLERLPPYASRPLIINTSPNSASYFPTNIIDTKQLTYLNAIESLYYFVN